MQSARRVVKLYHYFHITDRISGAAVDIAGLVVGLAQFGAAGLKDFSLEEFYSTQATLTGATRILHG